MLHTNTGWWPIVAHLLSVQTIASSLLVGVGQYTATVKNSAEHVFGVLWRRVHCMPQWGKNGESNEVFIPY